MRARVLIHYNDKSLIELDDGRLLKLNLKEHDGFDLGYAGSSMANNSAPLDQGFIYHSKANAIDDAPLIYQTSQKPVHVFYDEEKADSLQTLAHQMLGRRHHLTQSFTAISGLEISNDNGIMNEHEGREYESYRRD